MTEALARLGQTLSRGEVAQQQNISTKDFSIDNYYDVISKKTASLFEACCYLGAYAAGATEEDIVKACHFGHNIGIIFQIRDDIFDYSHDEKVGKPTGNDLREGKVTLPLIYALQQPGEQAEAMRRLLNTDSLSDAEIDTLIEFAKAEGGIDYAYQTMERIRTEAFKLLAPYADSEAKDAFLSLFNYIIKRQH